MQHLKPIKNVFLQQVYNQGRINLVVLHGLLGSKTNFKNIVNNVHISKHLASAYLLDVRNHGDSPQTQTMSYEEMANDLKHFILDHNLQNVVLLGHSMGGRIIFSYLQNYTTDLPIGNIIVDVGPGEGEGKNYVKQLQDIDLKNKTLKEIENNIFQVVQSKEKTNLIMTNLTYANKEEFHSDYKWRINIDVISKFMSNAHSEFYSNYQGSAFVICGEKSDYVSLNDREQFLKVFPKIDINRDIHFIKGAGHWVQVEKPRDFIKLTSQYLSSF
ncbi:unnamed protein product (macronuclear) [Paramecium tetraurelia]|uniref:AB hydrolase-1 domain-containing protein n=1 Tax=Paramecium tetraurelia TaxID=5888 RepID=A0DXD0_PARTE|nr:uncharacterized protein GSPATT00021330001 [Paramecium tetraurelia]CAK87697.1 unnamed protein product [Paramecium tetraurelia]|eukprot:XP_001455094.1 hypothetical protein (macronuclear) [Paramecium tetraurelia strain d4-2]